MIPLSYYQVSGGAGLEEANTESSLSPLVSPARKKPRKVREYNTCHNPPGPGGGQFCSGNGTGASGVVSSKLPLGRSPSHDPQELARKVLYAKQPTGDEIEPPSVKFAEEPGFSRQNKKWISDTETAKLIRGDLKQRFPGVKFSVRSHGSSVDVTWTDGPTGKEVQSLIDRYGGAGFDGMTDSTYYRTSEEGLPQSGAFLFAKRSLSPELQSRISQYVERNTGTKPGSYDFDTQVFRFSQRAKVGPKGELVFLKDTAREEPGLSGMAALLGQGEAMKREGPKPAEFVRRSPSFQTEEEAEDWARFEDRLARAPIHSVVFDKKAKVYRVQAAVGLPERFWNYYGG